MWELADILKKYVVMQNLLCLIFMVPALIQTDRKLVKMPYHYALVRVDSAATCQPTVAYL